MSHIAAFAGRAVLFAGVCFTLPAQNPFAQCDSHDWFALRQQVAGERTTLLCKGIVDSAFERRAEAERDLTQVLREEPRSESSKRAHEVLGIMFFREGRYKKADAQLEDEFVENPGDTDSTGSRSLFAALAQYPEQAVATSGPSVVHGENEDNNLFVPVTVNGVSGTYIVDSGANISVICESEARRLGLRIEHTTGKLFGAGALESTYDAEIADASDVWIGKTHLRHVGFLVIPDSSMPFVELPEGRKGILGIPVLIALGSIRIDSHDIVQIHPKRIASGREIPLAFDGAMPVTQVSLDGKTLLFTFDTGASHTFLHATFAATFPDLMKAGTKTESKVRGFAGSTNEESIELPALRFSLGKEVELKSAKVLLKAPVTAGDEWAAGNLGFDLISQAVPITIDFQSMRLIIEP